MLREKKVWVPGSVEQRQERCTASGDNKSVEARGLLKRLPQQRWIAPALLARRVGVCTIARPTSGIADRSRSDNHAARKNQQRRIIILLMSRAQVSHIDPVKGKGEHALHTVPPHERHEFAGMRRTYGVWRS